jgi:hypothetical protein
MRRSRLRRARRARIWACLLAAGAVLLPRAAWAVPSFATQTGQPCVACHIGAYGPQLTALGRAFKIGGYTQTGGKGWQASNPLSAMFQGSFNHTSKGQGAPAAPHYDDNNNATIDQISAFIAGRVTDYAGGMVQVTYDGVGRAFLLDNTDLRVTKPFAVGNSELQLGVDVNNNPTVQDPYNSTYAWGYPFVSSALVPTPTASPLLAGGFAGNVYGATVYAWYDQSLYLEAGLYNTYGPSLLSLTGQAYGPGSTANPAPYLRAAYEWNWAAQSAHVGGIFLHSNVNPATGPFSASGALGHDSYTDYALDGDWQYLGTGKHIVTVQGIFDHEDADLTGSYRAGAANPQRASLNDMRINANYYFQQTYGLTAAWQETWGSANPGLYAAAPLTGSANGKPDSTAFILEADWVPFGKAGAWAGPWVNLKLGAQYTIYTQFNGGTSNYDGFGRNASDNNSLYLFAWLIF